VVGLDNAGRDWFAALVFAEFHHAQRKGGPLAVCIVLALGDAPLAAIIGPGDLNSRIEGGR